MGKAVRGKASRAHNASRRRGRPQVGGLADALFTATQQRVLRLLFGQRERSFFLSELISLAGGGSGAVQREITRLVESGLVSAALQGRQRHFQANATSPLFKELTSIVLKTVGAADPIRSALRPLRDRVDRAWIYGSVAKGTDSASSDIDVLVVSDRLTLEDLFRAFEPVERVLGRRISPMLLTTAEFTREKGPMRPFLDALQSGRVIQLLGNSSSVAA